MDDNGVCFLRYCWFIQVVSSRRLRQVITRVLRFGNYVNHGVEGTKRLEVHGFCFGKASNKYKFVITIMMIDELI